MNLIAIFVLQNKGCFFCFCVDFDYYTVRLTEMCRKFCIFALIERMILRIKCALVNILIDRKIN